MNRRRGRKTSPPLDKPAACGSFDDVIVDEVKQLFSKVRGYSTPPPREWCLPDPGVVLCDRPWSHPTLQALKTSLNEVKNQLSDKDLSVWHQHTCSTNRAGTITAHLRETANAELCTQAWVKFYEILGSFRLVSEAALQSGEFNSVHLCEAPGAFISALNHFLQTSGLYCDWTWVANTLNPYHEANKQSCTISDDRLIAHTLPWWFFGSDNTGDIMLRKHLLELQAFVGDMRRVDLVTADGSFDCQGDPGEQESLVAPLQYCESVCALLLLAPGGSFVLKMFTLFEHTSVCLLYLLTCCFRSVHVFKPATSKSGNSEVYIVCLNLKSKDAVRPLLSKLIRNYGPDMVTMAALFPKYCIPESFLKQHEEICKFFHSLQINTIQENLQLFGGMTPERRWHLDQVRECAARFYVEHFQVQCIPRKRWLCRGGGGAGVAWAKSCQKKQVGSLNQRKEMQCKDWRQRLAPWMEEHFHGDQRQRFILTGPALEFDLNTWYCHIGASLPKVHSSVFCDPELLDLLNEALEEEQKSTRRALECRSCSIMTPVSVLNEICDSSHVVVVGGNPSWQDVPSSGNKLHFHPGPSYTASTLHDGDPVHQHQLLSSVYSALCELPEGSALVVLLGSALTRFTASLVLALHLCFQDIGFCSHVQGPSAVLLCVGFTSVPHLLHVILKDVLEQMGTLEPGRQVLQFAPMEELIRGTLPHFLSSLNNAYLKQQLHVHWSEQKC